MSTITDLFTNLGYIIAVILTSIVSFLSFIGYFFSILGYLIQMAYYSIIYIFSFFGSFISGFFDQFSLIGKLFKSIIDLIVQVFDVILYGFGAIISVFNYLGTYADNGDEELF